MQLSFGISSDLHTLCTINVLSTPYVSSLLHRQYSSIRLDNGTMRRGWCCAGHVDICCEKAELADRDPGPSTYIPREEHMFRSERGRVRLCVFSVVAQN